jgi:putative oxidoreductase
MTAALSTQPSLWRRADTTGIPLLLARLALGGVFIYMGVHKLGHPIEFLKQVHLYHMLPETPPYYLNATAIVLPWLEIFCGTLLIVGWAIRGASLQMLVMLSVFTPAILLRALAIHDEKGTPFMDIAFDCGCGSGVVITWKKLIENASLWLLALYALFSGSRRFTLAMLMERRKPYPFYCHLCAYRTKQITAGLCPRCATPPDVSADKAA